MILKSLMLHPGWVFTWVHSEHKMCARDAWWKYIILFAVYMICSSSNIIFCVLRPLIYAALKRMHVSLSWSAWRFIQGIWQKRGMLWVLDMSVVGVLVYLPWAFHLYFLSLIQCVVAKNHHFVNYQIITNTTFPINRWRAVRQMFTTESKHHALSNTML